MKTIEEQLHRPRTYVSFVVALLIVGFLFLSADWSEVLRTLSTLDPWWFLGAFVLFYVVFVVKALRWWIFMKNASLPVPFSGALEMLLLSQFVNCLVPAKLGDLYRAWIVKKRYSYSGSKVVGTLFVERLFDLVVMFSLLSLVVIVLFDASSPFQMVSYGGYALIVVILTLVLLLVYQRPLLLRLVPSRFSHYVTEQMEHFVEGCRESLPFPSFFATVFLTLVVWLGSAGVLWMVGGAFGAPMGFFLSLFVIVVSSALGVIPLTPAGLGVVEAGITGILVFVGISPELAVAIAVLERVIDYWSVLVIGFVDFVWRGE